MNAVVRVLLDAFDDKHCHYVIELKDNWISKEFIQASYNPAYAYDEASPENQHKNLPKRENSGWDTLE